MPDYYDEPEQGYELCSDCLEPVEEQKAKRISDRRLVTLANGEKMVAYDYTFFCSSCFAEYNPEL